MELSRLSYNQITSDHHSLEEVAQACAVEGVPYMAPWRHKLNQENVVESARIIREAGLKVSSLCRGGMFPAATETERLARLDDNRRAIDEAAELGTDVLVLVCGPSPDRDIEGARAMVEKGIEALIPYAEERHVKLGIEPLHPVFAGDRSVISTLGQANDIAERLASPQVGVVIDVYHVWWDPRLYQEIERSKGRILGFHVNDWIKVTDPLTSRGMMGDGVIEINRIRQAVEKAGYNGPVEVEILNHAFWNLPCEETIKQTKARFLEYV
ncbi:sugar phosphate isomerase/epimerase [Pullulanibacillus sp. KACC 23026]|uniref:sugar phosphate isomerase/epimerase family protein n=1 Tax=Pullulanibacillus sp. KACC 23026 TaxID=3028315 RepID=UPI0023B05A37|nr:sugar phosphate isomerase/epimerase family protein [Pullulanibacillus sp. KACC 23026]WEG13687.1 sugar phosphate isomerase/epimerase [Pullulanibacillus sp. KACC 23026]